MKIRHTVNAAILFTHITRALSAVHTALSLRTLRSLGKAFLFFGMFRILHLLVNSKLPFLTFVYLMWRSVNFDITDTSKNRFFSQTRFLEVPSYHKSQKNSWTFCDSLDRHSLQQLLDHDTLLFKTYRLNKIICNYPLTDNYTYTIIVYFGIFFNPFLLNFSKSCENGKFIRIFAKKLNCFGQFSHCFGLCYTESLPLESCIMVFIFTNDAKLV